MADRVSIGGTFFALIFGLAFAAAGGFFTYVLAHDIIVDLDTWLRWEQASCRILKSEVSRSKRDDDPYDLVIEYEFDTAGSTHRSQDYTIKGLMKLAHGYRTYDAANNVAQRYSPGDAVDCYYNPSNPSSSCLKRVIPWYGLIILFPLFFLIVGLAIMSAPFLKLDEKKPGEKALSARAAGGITRRGRLIGFGLLALFFSIFLLAGLSMIESTVLYPLRKTREAAAWTEKTCRVVSSSVQIDRGDESDSYTPDILFEYDHGGKTYRSSQLNFLNNFGTSSHREARSIVRLHPPGAKVPCYNNPANPGEAVIQRDREVSAGNFAAAGAFFMIGLLGVCISLYFALRSPAEKPRGRFEAAFRRSKAPDAVPRPDAKMLVIESTQTKRLAGIGIGIFVSLFWNGIIVFVGYDLFKGGFSAWHIFIALFLSIFVLIGLSFIVLLVIYPIISLFSPRFRVEVNPGSFRPGERLEFRWSISGRIARASALKIHIEGVEEATYTRGTDTVTDREVFQIIELGGAEGAALQIGAGSGSKQAPESLLPSFSASNNRIVWYVRALLVVKGLPDVFEEGQIRVFGKGTNA